LAYVVACGLAAALAFIEQFNRLEARPPVRQWGWFFWLLRFGLDAGAAALAVTFTRKNIEGGDTLFGWLAAGAASSAILRSRFIDIGRGAAARRYGISQAYEQIRAFIEDQIDGKAASRQSWWLNQKVFPAVHRSGKSPADCADRLKDYVNGLAKMQPREKQKEVKWLDDVLAGDESDSDKRELIVRRAVLLKAYGVVKDMMKSET
jgi:hypothetical protein